MVFVDPVTYRDLAMCNNDWTISGQLHEFVWKECPAKHVLRGMQDIANVVSNKRMHLYTEL